jgi:phasin family protein
MSTAKAKGVSRESLAASVEQAMSVGKETVEQVVKASTEAATAGYEQAIALTKEQAEKVSATTMKNYDEMAQLSKQTIDALFQAGNVLAKGAESVAKELAGFAQGRVESNIATTKKLFGCTTVQEAMDIQTGFLKSSFDTWLAEGSKLSELTFKVANEAFDPINARVNEAIERLTKSARVAA